MAASIPSSSRNLFAQCIHPFRSASTSSTSSLRQFSVINSTRSVRPQKRDLHSLPRLPANLKEGDGCEPLFSAQTVRLLWDDWHAGLLSKLNDEVRGTPWENSSIVETVIGTSQDPTHIQAFNYASMALNNSFFLAGLKSKEMPEGTQHWADSPPRKPYKAFMSKIEQSFESLPAFKLAFSSAAYGMSGSGYVWLVQDQNRNLGIVPTFGAGTILVQNRTQRNGDNPSTSFEASKVNSIASNDNQGKVGGSFSSSPSPQIRQFSSSRSLDISANPYPDSTGEELFPLLCVSVHERDWLPDYGMWGKEEYLMRFWECVNWDRVQSLHDSYNNA